MTIAGTAFRSAPCTACGETDWCEAETGLCFECRKAIKMPTDLIKYENDIKPHSTALSEYLSPDARDYQLATQDDFAEAGVIINEIKDRAKQLEAMEKSATKPILAGAEVIRAWFRPARKAADEARALWDTKIKIYLAKQAQVQQEVQRKIEASVAAGQPAELALLEPTPVAAGISVVRSVDWEVVDIELVPSAHLCVDEASVSILCKGAKELPVVPGIRFFWKTSVRAVGRGV